MIQAYKGRLWESNIYGVLEYDVDVELVNDMGDTIEYQTEPFWNINMALDFIDFVNDSIFDNMNDYEIARDKWIENWR